MDGSALDAFCNLGKENVLNEMKTRKRLHLHIHIHNLRRLHLWVGGILL